MLPDLLVTLAELPYRRFRATEHLAHVSAIQNGRDDDHVHVPVVGIPVVTCRLMANADGTHVARNGTAAHGYIARVG